MGKSEFKVACRSVLTKPQKMALATKVHSPPCALPSPVPRMGSSTSYPDMTQVKQDYRVHMIMDNLPAATKMIAEMPDGSKMDMYDRGFRLGFLGSKDIPGTDPGKCAPQKPWEPSFLWSVPSPPCRKAQTELRSPVRDAGHT